MLSSASSFAAAAAPPRILPLLRRLTPPSCATASAIDLAPSEHVLQPAPWATAAAAVRPAASTPPSVLPWRRRTCTPSSPGRCPLCTVRIKPPPPPPPPPSPPFPSSGASASASFATTCAQLRRPSSASLARFAVAREPAVGASWAGAEEEEACATKGLIRRDDILAAQKPRFASFRLSFSFVKPNFKYRGFSFISHQNKLQFRTRAFLIPTSPCQSV